MWKGVLINQNLFLSSNRQSIVFEDSKQPIITAYNIVYNIDLVKLN